MKIFACNCVEGLIAVLDFHVKECYNKMSRFSEGTLSIEKLVKVVFCSNFLAKKIYTLYHQVVCC